MEPIFKRKNDPRNYRNPEPPCIVCLSSTNILTYIDDSCSVSSVQTLEEAKVTRGCLYMAIPVQEVCNSNLQGYMLMVPYLTVRNFAMGKVRGNTRKRIPGSHEDTGAMGTRGKASDGIYRGKGLECEEEERTECKEELDLKVHSISMCIYDARCLMTR